MDPATVVVSPDLSEPFLRGLPYARHNLALDLAALTKHEMILWDIWGSMNLDPAVSDTDALRADSVAAIDPDDSAALRAAFDSPDFRIPPVIRTLSPTTRTLTEVPLPPASPA
ncbi:hypothetical protein GCM10018954_023880 [Kutzneria kofuensis]